MIKRMGKEILTVLRLKIVYQTCAPVYFLSISIMLPLIGPIADSGASTDKKMGSCMLGEASIGLL